MTLSTRETHPNHHAACALSGLVRWLGLNGGHSRRHALAELAALEDWQLEDVGLTRQRLERELTAAGVHDDPELRMHSGSRWNRNG